MSPSVLIVDDHAHYRRTARRALQRDGWTIAGEAGDGEEGLRAARELEPDVVLVDVGLPGASGLEIAKRLTDELPDIAVVVISTQDPGDYEELATANGARGFLAKADLTSAALAAVLQT